VALSEGDIVAGKYRIERRLGEGGMGIVFCARHLKLDDVFALKVLTTGAGDATIIARFEREARAAAKIKSEHVARVVDVDVLADGTPFLVMEYLEGTDLGGLLEQCGPLPIGDAISYMLQACEAVAEAHAAGIVHRDLKPANLFLAKRADGTRTVKVLDFGISKLMSGGPEAPLHTKLTGAGALLGTPFYMSPEQMKSAATVDARSDIWALGLVLYELLAGFTPFRGGTLTEVVASVIADPLPPLEGARPDVPPELAAIVAKCLQKLPDDRYPNVPALMAALTPWAAPSVSVPSAILPRSSAPFALAATAAGFTPMAVAETLRSASTTGLPATSAAWDAGTPAVATSSRSSVASVLLPLALGTLVLLAALVMVGRKRSAAPSEIPAAGSAEVAPMIASAPTAAVPTVTAVRDAAVPTVATTPVPRHRPRGTAPTTPTANGLTMPIK
jgi:serine/threonine-protein kinase